MQSKFYTINPAVDTKEVGIIFPSVRLCDGYNFSGKNSVHKLSNWKFPDFIPDIRFDLVKGANLCDVMSNIGISTSGLLVSERLKNFLENFNLGNHRFYEATIFTEKKAHKYFWLHILWNERDQIVDYRQSSFFKKRSWKNLGELDINSIEEYYSKKEELGSRFMIGFHRLTLNTSPSYDLWPVPFRVNLIVNSTLKMELQNAEFTGIQISHAGRLFQQT